MWDWIMKTTKWAVRSSQISENFKDDIVQETMLYFLKNEKAARAVFEKKEKAYIMVIVKGIIFDQTSKSSFKDKTMLTRYNRIIRVCEQYGIEPVKENAYKIAAILKDSNYTILKIEYLFSQKTEIEFVSYEQLVEAQRESEAIESRYD